MAHAKKARRSRQNRRNINTTWFLAIVTGGIVMVVAALSLVSRQNDPPGQTAFDSNFEPEVTGAPRVKVVQDEVINYGDVKLDTTINTVYTVRNVGDEPLVVLGEPRVELVEGC